MNQCSTWNIPPWNIPLYSQFFNPMKIVRIKFRNPTTGQSLWSLPVLGESLDVILETINRADNVPSGTICDVQQLGTYDRVKGRVSGCLIRALLIKGYLKPSKPETKRQTATDIVDSQSAEVPVAGDCE